MGFPFGDVCYDVNVLPCCLNVIASAAKQSILSLCRAMDCFVARAPRNDADGVYFLPAISLAAWPNMFLRASSSNGALTNLPIASPACTCGRARTSAYQRLRFG